MVRAADGLALACHHHPDGDALGFDAGHAPAVRGQRQAVGGVVARAVRGRPALRVPPRPRHAASRPSEFPDAPDVLVTFDLGSPDRLGSLERSVDGAGTVVVLDHHPDNERFGTHNLVLTDVAATAVIVRLLADELGWKLTREVALCLYVGLVTDTGRFQYPNTTPDVFHLAEELANYDLDIADVTRELFEKHRFPYVQMMSMALARAELDADLRFVSAWLTLDDLDRYGVAFDETEGFIDHLRGCAEAEVSCVLKEAPGEGLRVSLRSTGPVDVGDIATELGGGGHAFMSGFVSEVGIAETIEQVRARVAERTPPVSRAKPSPHNGLVLVDKEVGWTSHDVVAKARGVLGTRKVGHAGTLDPPATGLLLVGVGSMTRLLRFLTALPKTYVGEIVLGTETDTLDDTGETTATFDMDGVTLADVRAAAADLTGDILQMPPMVSAVKVDGKRLHELAREGKEVEREARPVTDPRLPGRRADRAGHLPGRGDVLVGHLHPHPGRRRRHGARRRSPPAQPPPHPGRLALGGRRPSHRPGHSPRPRADAGRRAPRPADRGGRHRHRGRRRPRPAARTGRASASPRTTTARGRCRPRTACCWRSTAPTGPGRSNPRSWSSRRDPSPSDH